MHEMCRSSDDDSEPTAYMQGIDLTKQDNDDVFVFNGLDVRV